MIRENILLGYLYFRYSTEEFPLEQQRLIEKPSFLTSLTEFKYLRGWGTKFFVGMLRIRKLTVN